MIDGNGSASLLADAPRAGLPSPAEFRRAVLAAAAEALGLEVQRVQLAFQHGLSLADLAEDRGVPKSGLVRALARAIERLNAEGDGLPGAPDPFAMARRIADRRGGLQRRRHLRVAEPEGFGDPIASSSPLAVISSVLGMSQNGIRSALESGTSLTDLLAERGLSVETFDTAA
ncbi:MAG TPA: hypothetical protein VJ986_04175 [Gaiellaceae bacterium]|nr:hypothetical protein [Gaiellaceae bacterium]